MLTIAFLNFLYDVNDMLAFFSFYFPGPIILSLGKFASQGTDIKVHVRKNPGKIAFDMARMFSYVHACLSIQISVIA